MDDWNESPNTTNGGPGSGGSFGRGGFGRGAGRGGSNMTTETGHWGEPPIEHIDMPPVDNRLRGFGRGRILRGRSAENSGGFGSSNGGGGGGFGRGAKRGPADDSVNSGGDNGSRGGFGGGFKKNDDENNNTSGGGGFGKSGGFGRGGGGGGFGSSSGGGGGFGSSSGGGGGFGSSSGGGGGFGSSSGGGGGGGGFGSRNSDEPRGGGFGSGKRFGGGDDNGGRSSGSGCHKCGEDGHFARECPQGGGGGGRSSGGSGCYKCGGDGHFARECPQADGDGGGRSGGFGRGGGGGGGGGSSGGSCYKCGESGHFARECPQADGDGGGRSGGFGRGGGGGGGGGGSSGGGCYKCGESGHFARECPNEESGGGGGPRGDGEKPREIYIPPAPPEDEEEIFKTMQRGINFDKYDHIPVKCTGEDNPKKGITSFAEAALHQALQTNVRKAHYEKPTPVQKWAIPIILSGRDLMSCAQTGSGKTAAFLLPVCTRMLEDGLSGSQFSEVQEPQALVIGPTRELVVQIFHEARKFANGTMLRPVVAYGGASVGHQLRQIEQGAHLLVGTPGRLKQFLEQGKISLAKCKYLILDEADRMLDMGFKPEVEAIVQRFKMPSKTERQTLMFSATFPDEVQRLAANFLNNYLFVTVGTIGGANVDITQTIHKVTHHEKRDKLCEILRNSGNQRTLVFVEQKRNADFLASFLSQSDFPTTSIHGDRLQREREEALRDFKKGTAPVLVATSVAARGLDIPDVMHVINYDMPKDISEYVHRIGRTGRCGNEGRATSFFNPDNDGEMARPLVKTLQEAQQEVPEWLEQTAETSFGAGGFTGVGGQFASRDTRKGNFGGDDAGGFQSNGFGGGGSAAAEEEESWD